MVLELLCKRGVQDSFISESRYQLTTMNLAKIQIRRRSLLCFATITVIYFWPYAYAFSATTLPHRSDAQLIFELSLKSVEVELCFRGTERPNFLIAGSELRHRISHIRAKRTGAAPLTLRLDGNILRLPETTIRCLGYAVDLSKEQSDDWRSGFSDLVGAIVVELERLLFRQDWDAQREGEIIYINTGDQVNASAPGSVIERSRSRTGFKLMDRPMDWHGKLPSGMSASRLLSADAKTSSSRS